MKAIRRRPRSIGLVGTVCALVIGSPVVAEASESGIDATVQAIASIPVDAEFGEYLAGECATCHAAQTSVGSGIPRLAGKDRDYLIRAMVEYRTGVRDNQVMNATMATKGNEEIAALAAWFSSEE